MIAKGWYKPVRCWHSSALLRAQKCNEQSVALSILAIMVNA
jgi:hypothetical protein